MIRSFREKFICLPKSKKIQLITAFAITLILIVAVPIVAWFSYSRKLGLTTEINAPTKIYITAGEKESVVNLDLSDIDVEEIKNGQRVTSKDFVMGIAGTDVKAYKIQLAHTTNIPFKYTLYRAAQNENGEVIYVDEKGTSHNYKIGDNVIGGYINSEASGQIANDSQHKRTYGSYNNVQKNAEPLYWQSDEEDVSQTEGSSNEFCDYYVIRVSWDESLSNDKETDMVYITVMKTK